MLVPLAQGLESEPVQLVGSQVQECLALGLVPGYLLALVHWLTGTW